MTVERQAALPIELGSAAALDEAAWIRAAQAGDQAAFERLVRAYDRSVLRLALNLLRSEEDAYDVYQETFLRVFRNLHSFRFDCNFQTWLYRIVSNLCVDLLRKRKVRREEPAVVETSEGPRDRLEGFQEGSARGDPERTLLSRQLGERIERVLGGLTPGSAWCLSCVITRACG